MAGANFAAICNVFGSEAKLRIKSCEFHFKEQRNKKARRLDDDSASQFKDLCESMLISTTLQAYNSAKERMDNFIEEREDRGFLTSWISWWHERRGFIFRAFSPKNAPQMNQAEVIHAGWVHRDSPNLSLLDVCQADVRDSIILDAELKAYEGGSSSAGTGPSYSDLQRREHVRQITRAKQMGREMLEEEESGLLIDPSSTHKPAQKRSRTTKVLPKKKAAASAQRISSDKSHEGAGSRNPDINHLTNIHSFDHQPFSSSPSSSINVHQFGFRPTIHSFGGATPSPVHPAVLQMHQQAYRLPTMSPNSHHIPLPTSQQPLYQPYQPYGLPQWFSGLSPHPYEIVMLPPNVRKCYGCGCDFTEKYRSPPYNLIVKHMDKRVISKNADGQLLYSNDFSNTYYHPSSVHIKRKNPAFTGLVYIDGTFYNSLSQQQRQVLDGCEFNIHFT